MGFLKMTRLAVELLLPTSTPFVDQKWALRAADVVWVAVMVNSRVAAAGTPLAVEPTFWWPCAARLRRLQDSAATVATDLMKYRLGTAPARTPVTDLLTIMAAALQGPAASLDAEMLRLDGVDVCGRPILPPRCLSLCGLSLTRTAVLAALVTATAEVCLAGPHAQGML